MLNLTKRINVKNKYINFMLDIFVALFVFVSASFVSYLIKIFLLK
jgi:hypothetical protein